MEIDQIKLPIHNLFPDDLFPDQNGLVALGGDLSIYTLIEAYSRGIFPWAGSHPIPWYSPDPRLVLFPDKFHASLSLLKQIKKKNIIIKYDENFKMVIHHCASIKRKMQPGTWIDKNIRRAYTELFEYNIAHCIEVYMDEELAGGLYGLSLGKTFFGESMFSLKPNGSKIALYYLSIKCMELKIDMIDCQQSTSHMLSMGAEEISRELFLQKLDESMKLGINIHKWAKEL